MPDKLEICPYTMRCRRQGLSKQARMIVKIVEEVYNMVDGYEGLATFNPFLYDIEYFEKRLKTVYGYQFIQLASRVADAYRVADLGKRMSWDNIKTFMCLSTPSKVRKELEKHPSDGVRAPEDDHRSHDSSSKSDSESDSESDYESDYESDSESDYESDPNSYSH